MTSGFPESARATVSAYPIAGNPVPGLVDPNPHLTDDQVRRLIEIVEEEEPVIIGGQALNLWAQYFEARGHPEFSPEAPLTSKDLDFYRNKEPLSGWRRNSTEKCSFRPWTTRHQTRLLSSAAWMAGSSKSTSWLPYWAWRDAASKTTVSYSRGRSPVLTGRSRCCFYIPSTALGAGWQM